MDLVDIDLVDKNLGRKIRVNNYKTDLGTLSDKYCSECSPTQSLLHLHRIWRLNITQYEFGLDPNSALLNHMY